ncbi:MAG TPA: 16S rRNA (guanine(527)-N(7))-methyltransferase RsmG [Solirubrobacterales bacterium]
MRVELEAGARRRLEVVLAQLVEDPRSLTSVREPKQAWRAHVADSLTGLEVPELRAARAIADVGAGAGFPAFPLAVALPDARIDAIESVARKCGFIAAAAEAAGISNVRAVNARSEEWARETPPDGGREAYDAVTARAVARLATLAELASPLLREGGVLVAWKGRRDPEEEAELERALEPTAMAAVRVLAVGELVGYEHRHLHVLRKAGPTPANLPRRPGIAKKRPFGAK